jgi:hypothetical protein
MEKLSFKSLALTAMVTAFYSTNAQWNPAWYPAPGFNSGYSVNPMIQDAPPWAMGGNQVGITPNGSPADYACGTSDGNPFSLMANGQLQLNIDQGGRVAIGTNYFPSISGCKLDVRGSGSNLRIYGDAAGVVHSTSDMKLHFGATGSISEFQINHGDPGSATTRMLFNVWGAHIHTGGIFNGLFIGPASSTWYNNSSSHRIWLDAINSGGIAIVGGSGNDAMFVANAAGAKRYSMNIAATAGDDTKFDMRGSVQMGFYQSTASWEDVNARLNIAPLSIGAKVSTNSSGVKAFMIDDPNTTSDPFIVFGNGKTQIGPGKPLSTGPAANAMLSVDGMILAREVRVSVSQSVWADYVFDKNYKLTPLADVETYYKKNHHLPEIPSAAEVEQNGVDITDMNKLLLQKVEELTIYLVEQQKQIDALKKQVEKEK